MEGPPSKIEEINANSLIYIDLNYPTSSLPENASILWEDFNWKLRWFPSDINAFDEIHEFQKSELWNQMFLIHIYRIV